MYCFYMQNPFFVLCSIKSVTTFDNKLNILYKMKLNEISVKFYKIQMLILCITKVFVYFIHTKFIFTVSYIPQFNYHSTHTVITRLRIFMHLWGIWKCRNAFDVWKRYIKYPKYKVKYKNVYHLHMTYCIYLQRK